MPEAELIRGLKFSLRISGIPAKPKEMKPNFLLMTFGLCAILPSCQPNPQNNAGVAPVQPNSHFPPAQPEVGVYQPVAPVEPVAPVTPAYTPPPVYTPAPAPAPAPAAGGASHTVAKGDTLWGISRQYNTTVEAISAANGLSGTTILPGQTLVIPQ